MLTLTVDEQTGTIAFTMGSQVEAARQHSHLVDDHALWVPTSVVQTQFPALDLALRTCGEFLVQAE